MLVLGLGLLPSNVSTRKRLPAPVAPTTRKGDLMRSGLRQEYCRPLAQNNVSGKVAA
jgi:hypothetical protein